MCFFLIGDHQTTEEHLLLPHSRLLAGSDPRACRLGPVWVDQGVSPFMSLPQEPLGRELSGEKPAPKL